MTSPHSDPAAHGTRFGDVLVTVDRDLGDAVIRVPMPGTFGQGVRTTRFNSLEEVVGAYALQAGRAAIDPVAADYARALKFAAQMLGQSQEDNRNA